MNPWRYEPASDLDKSVIDRLRRFPREPDMLVYGLRSAAALALRGWLKMYHRFEIAGRENLPRRGSFIMVANHSSHLDTLCLLAGLPLRKLHRVFPAAAQDYFFVSVPRLAIAAVVVNALPFARKKNFRHSLEVCRELLANSGNVLILFPEGTRTMTGEIKEFKPGIGLLAAGAGVPVVPCFLRGAFAAWPKGRFLPRPRRLTLHIGTPRIFTGHTLEKESAEKISRELRDAVVALSTVVE
ncbi:MAG TPA: lysophospholipid acyltransferase family protein [Verrucomicrobiae bacterium]|nr:lysophospholipid acyltransferase family protein [Verrucomicrobiae bacterium]